MFGPAGTSPDQRQRASSANGAMGSVPRCGHAGAVMIVRHAMRLTGVDRLHGLVAW